MAYLSQGNGPDSVLGAEVLAEGRRHDHTADLMGGGREEGAGKR